MSFENKNSYTKILVNDDMEVANKSMDLNRCNITSDKSDGIKENDTILIMSNPVLENVISAILHEITLKLTNFSF